MSKNLKVEKVSPASNWYREGMRWSITFHGSKRYFTEKAIKELQKNINEKLK